jgi:hypothetical protein
MNATGQAQTADVGDPYHATGQAHEGAGSGDERASGISDALIEIAGAKGDSLFGALAAWQREQDRLANRAWRRPGGMARPAGL